MEDLQTITKHSYFIHDFTAINVQANNAVLLLYSMPALQTT